MSTPDDPARDDPGLLERNPIYDGRIVDLSVDRVRFPDGSTGELEMIRHSGAAAVLPVLGTRSDPDPEILLVRQYRYAAGGSLIEIPAGRPDTPDEPWEVCARREVEEETGFIPETLVRLTSIHTTPGFTDEVIHLFLAYDLRTGEADLDTDEFLEPLRIPLNRALELVRQGRISDAKTICALLFAARFDLGTVAERGHL